MTQKKTNEEIDAVFAWQEFERDRFVFDEIERRDENDDVDDLIEIERVEYQRNVLNGIKRG